MLCNIPKAQGATYPGDIHFTRENSKAKSQSKEAVCCPTHLTEPSFHSFLFLLIKKKKKCILLIFFLFGHWVKKDIPEIIVWWQLCSEI